MAVIDGINQEKQQRLNRTLVIDLLRQEGICSRANLARLSGLRRTTITNIVNEFIERDLIVEDGLLEGDKGRRSIGIRINGRRYRVVGVMVTRKYYCLSLMGLSGEIFQTETYPIGEEMDAETIIAALKRQIHLLIDGADDWEALAIGFAMPGPYKREGGEMVFVTNLIGWEGIPLYSRLQEGFDIPIFIENDANAGAYAQLWFRGKKSELRNLVYIVAGQGIGCGMVTAGELLRGELGIAGEIGHTTINYDGPLCECGNRGCLEKYCSLITLEENLRAQIRAGASTVLREAFTFGELCEAVRAGDPVARTEYTRACGFLAVGIVNMINQINPRIVIIGDQLAAIQPGLLLDIVRKKVRESVRPIVWENLSMEINSLDHNPVLIGAGAIAAQHIFERPYEYLL